MEFEFRSKLKIKLINIINKYFLKKLNYKEKICCFCSDSGSGLKIAHPNAELIRSKNQIKR